MFVVAGTGHRSDKLGGYDSSTYERVFKCAVIALQEQRPDLVISGMALGWDMALAEAAYALEIKFKAYVPFEGQESKWPRESRRLYLALLGKAESVVHVSSPGYSAQKMWDRNVRMVDDCDLLVALWDGSSGGTSNCLSYAKRAGRTSINYWDIYQGIK